MYLEAIPYIVLLFYVWFYFIEIQQSPTTTTSEQQSKLKFVKLSNCHVQSWINEYDYNALMRTCYIHTYIHTSLLHLLLYY